MMVADLLTEREKAELHAATVKYNERLDQVAKLLLWGNAAGQVATMSIAGSLISASAFTRWTIVPFSFFSIGIVCYGLVILADLARLQSVIVDKEPLFYAMVEGRLVNWELSQPLGLVYRQFAGTYSVWLFGSVFALLAGIVSGSTVFFFV